jgi:hypothetical protein
MIRSAHPAWLPVPILAAPAARAEPRELAIVYDDSDKSPRACFAHGIVIATYASVGQRMLTIAPERALDGAIPVAIIKPQPGARVEVQDPHRRSSETRRGECQARSARPLGRSDE